MPPHEGSCQIWNFHNCHPGEDWTFPKDRSLLLTSDTGRAVLCIGKPLIAMTTGHQRLGHHRKLEPKDPDCTMSMQTFPIWMWNQGTHMSLPLLVCQPFKTYWAEDLSLSLLNPQCTELPVIPGIWMLLLLPMELLASSNLTMA